MMSFIRLDRSSMLGSVQEKTSPLPAITAFPADKSKQPINIFKASLCNNQTREVDIYHWKGM